MSGNSTYEPGKRQFDRGMLLAWAPILALIIAITSIFRGGISEHKATGLGAVAGGLAEGYLVFGLVLTFAFEIGGIVLLARSLTATNATRSLISAMSIAWSLLMLLLSVFFVWNFVFLPQR